MYLLKKEHKKFRQQQNLDFIKMYIIIFSPTPQLTYFH